MRRERELFRMAACAVAVVVASSSVPAIAQEKGGSAPPKPSNINIVFGQKMLDDKDWNKEFKAAGLPNLKNQTLYGVQMSWAGPSWPVALATDLLYSSASGKSSSLNRTVTGTTFELGLGARKFFALGPPVSPYAGGGLTWGTGFVTCDGCSSKAPNGTGLWAEGGAVYRLGRLNAGLGARYSNIDGSDGGVKLKVGGLNVNAVLGFGW